MKKASYYSIVCSFKTKLIICLQWYSWYRCVLFSFCPTSIELTGTFYAIIPSRTPQLDSYRPGI